MKTVDELKELLKTKKAKEINFKEFDLRGADLRGADLSASFFYGADLRGANLEGANLCGSFFINVDFRDANLFKSHFFYSKLFIKDVDGNQINETLFKNTIIDRENFEYLKKRFNVKEEDFIIKRS